MLVARVTDDITTTKNRKKMKILITIPGFLNDGYMLLDGLYVTIKGKYIGPAEIHFYEH